MQKEEYIVDRRELLTQQQFINEYVSAGRPVVLTDAAQRAGWPACQKWSPEYLKELVGSNKVTIRGGRFHITAQSEDCLFREYLDRALDSTPAKPAPYMYGVSIPEVFPQLMSDISDLPYYFPDRLRSRLVPPARYKPNGELTFLVGGKGASFPELHVDNWCMDVFITQIRGDKTFLVFSPDQTEYVYQDPNLKTKSLIPNVENVDLEKFPLFAKAQLIAIHAKEGETIYLPSGWWHTTKILNFSVAVSMNTLNAYNWHYFSANLCDTRHNANPIRRFAKRSYFLLGGAYLTLRETIRLR